LPDIDANVKQKVSAAAIVGFITVGGALRIGIFGANSTQDSTQKPIQKTISGLIL
jgi:hypothetical protein